MLMVLVFLQKFGGGRLFESHLIFCSVDRVPSWRYLDVCLWTTECWQTDFKRPLGKNGVVLGGG
jgi:hypothetical protein